MRCPQCDHDQVFPGAECERCGVIFARLRDADPDPMATSGLAPEAEEVLDTLMDMSPSFPEAFCHMALLCFHKNEKEEGLKWLDKAEKQNF